MAQTRHLVLGLMPRGADPDTHWAAGPWCFDTEEDFFPGWEDSFVFGREPLRDPATLDRAVLMAQSLTVDSIPALGRHLLDLQRRRAEENNPVSTLLGPDEIDLPGVYWETLLTPWACTVARQLVERWLRVRAMVEDWGHLPLHVELLPEDCAFSFATEHDFVMSGALGADWNTWLMSRLLEAVWPERWTRSYALPVCASYGRLIPPEDSGSLKQRLRAWARSCVLRLPCPPLRGMRLHQALRYSLALLHPSRQSDASRPLAAHFGSAATGVEHDLPLDPLPIFIGALPQTLAELDHPDHVAPARVPRVRAWPRSVRMRIPITARSWPSGVPAATVSCSSSTGATWARCAACARPRWWSSVSTRSAPGAGAITRPRGRARAASSCRCPIPCWPTWPTNGAAATILCSS